MTLVSEEFRALFKLPPPTADSDIPQKDQASAPMPAPFRPSDPQLYFDESAYVTRYETEFQHAFGSGTAISWDILYSDDIGGNFDPSSDDSLFITAWNRAALGCEALVAYYKTTSPGLAIFDHKLGCYDRLPARSMSAFAPYIRAVEVGGFAVSSISLVNMTYREKGSWINEVYLPPTSSLPALKLYKSAKPYAATPEAQRTKYQFDGSYGPTIEPSRGPLEPFKGLNPLGWANTKLNSRDANGTWGEWELLSPEQSHIEPGSGGFGAAYSEGNHTAILTVT